MSNVITEIESTVNELYVKTNVTQKFTNPSENPLELKIYVFKKEEIIFSCFSCKIGDSINVKSKVIKKEKAEKKYTDSVASGNAAIFVSDDPDNENRLIINMGNIPSKADVIFTSEFLHPIEVSQKYEFELFRNLPIFKGKDDEIYKNTELKGKINIMTKNEILNVEKNILMKNLETIEEKYKNEKKNEYSLIYQIKELPNFSWYNSDNYIPSSKIYFDLNMSQPFAYSQESSLNNNEINYFIQYKYKKEKSSNEKETTNPALFIFLVDQSGSMDGHRIKIASKALQLFLQSLPVGSYYQIIGFGSRFKKYDEIPKEYNKENIKKSMEILEKLDADLGGTEVAKPLKDIYDSNNIYDKINLPKNIFLLTDGETWDKKEALELIEKNSSKFTVYSIGIGEDFDEDLIKNAGILGKGNYNYCKNLDNLNSIIASEINKATSPYISNLKINTNLDNENIIKNNVYQNIIRDNEIVNLYYIIEKNKNKDKINLDINYLDSESNKNVDKTYEIIPEKIEKGEDLSKLIINNYILNNKDLSEDEKIKLALKYQILTRNTSLFAEVELSDKITEEMKLKIIGDKENNVIKQIRKQYNYDYEMEEKCCMMMEEKCCMKMECCDEYDDEEDFCCCKAAADDDECCDDDEGDDDDDRDDDRGYRAKKIMSFGNPYKAEKKEECCNKEEDDSDLMGNNDLSNKNINNNEQEKKEECLLEKENDKKNEEKEVIQKKEEKQIELNNKENLMKMINTQDFIDGCWEENNYTKLIKEKYQKEFDLLKTLKNKNINDRTALTILVIYFINKEHSELLKDLIMIIKKGKIFIQKETNDSYENIIKEIGLN